MSHLSVRAQVVGVLLDLLLLRMFSGFGTAVEHRDGLVEAEVGFGLGGCGFKCGGPGIGYAPMFSLRLTWIRLAQTLQGRFVRKPKAHKFKRFKP